VSTPESAPSALHLFVGYDGSPPAHRALDGAVRLLQGRTGRIDVVYVAHLSSTVMLSADAVAEMETDFDEVEQDLRTEVGEHLRDLKEPWGFVRRQGLITEELIAAATTTPDADATVVIVVGSSSHATHRLVGSVAVGLARHSPVPLVIVP
jgi:nucleotide-binding universal stress UspA family protein